MRELSVFEAASMIGCTSFWIHALLKQQLLCSLRSEEVQTFKEKAPAMFDTDLNYELHKHFLRV